MAIVSHALSSFCALVVALNFFSQRASTAPPSSEPSAHGPLWNLPAHITDDQISVSFEVDSTWHLVHGTTSGVTGDVWLANPNDPHSVRARIVFPILNFHTNKESRDLRLLEVVHADRFSVVTFSVLSMSANCNPRIRSRVYFCSQIKGVTRTTFAVRRTFRRQRADRSLTVFVNG